MDERLRLPELHDQRIDEATARSLARDVGLLGEQVEVRAKGEERGRARAAPWTPAQAVEALLRGELRGVQLLYRHQGVEWMDTLLRQPAGLRIVRMRAPGGTDAPP